MTKEKAFAPTISILLVEFFDAYKPTAGRTVRQRIQAVREDLVRQLEVEGPRELTTPQLAIVETERQFDPTDCLARTMHADELFYVLSTYLRPEFEMKGHLQRQAQLDAVGALADMLWARGLIKRKRLDECAVLDFNYRMGRGLEDVRALRQASLKGRF
jgi:hypothetical protein